MDTYRHKGLRKKLVETLQMKGITDEGVLKAVNTIPRHLFLDNVFVDFAYQDKAFPISAGQTISHPFTVAFQTQLLEIKRGDKVLEIGTGSAYQTCVLLEMKAKVFSIERHRVLYQKAKIMLEKMNYTAKLFFGDGYLGQPAFAPYDKIIITAGAPYIPEDLKQQLKVGGIMVIPVGEGDSQVMKRLIKKNETTFEVEEYGDFKFVPLLQNKSFTK